jgi:formate hydrogenlyase subunit 6/NADH:ubiquinone oxidoreductase subunit I
MELRGEGNERHIAIDYRVCIRCYCCHEICPVKAIDIVKPPLLEKLKAGSAGMTRLKR